MGLLLSLPIAGVAGSVGSSCLAGLAFCCTSTAGMSLSSVLFGVLRSTKARQLPCSSSRATATPPSPLVLDLRLVLHTPMLDLCSQLVSAIDHILTQFVAGVADEDAVRHQAH